jgi:uncharacterized protein with von Willebrand factor type A (vWA) domain
VNEVPLRLARLGRSLRAHGVGTTLRDELDAAGALALVDRDDRHEVRRALRIALKVPRAAFETFDRLFEAFWRGEEVASPAAPRPREAPVAPRGVVLHWDPATRRLAVPGASERGDRPGYSPEALRRRQPLEPPGSSADLARMERLLSRLARRMATRKSRRMVPTAGRGRADVRASYRRALRTGGELVQLARRSRAVEEPRLAILLDTSGSMDAHTRFLLTFALALRGASRRAEVFAFNTELVHLTGLLRPGRVRSTLDRVAAAVPDWSGGTRIGACLAAFHDLHLARWPPGQTVVVVVSDGLDRGDTEVLAKAARAVRRRARRLVWLNPLLGDVRYEPTAGGMRAALPFVDTFASAHDLESLERVVPRLVS